MTGDGGWPIEATACEMFPSAASRDDGPNFFFLLLLCSMSLVLRNCWSLRRTGGIEFHLPPNFHLSFFFWCFSFAPLFFVLFLFVVGFEQSVHPTWVTLSAGSGCSVRVPPERTKNSLEKKKKIQPKFRILTAWDASVGPVGSFGQLGLFRGILKD